MTSKTVLQKYFSESWKALQTDSKKVFKMFGDVSASKKPIKLDIEGEEVVLNKRKLTSQFNSLFGNSSPIYKIFKLANKGMSLRYAPVFLTEETIKFVKDAENVLGQTVVGKLRLFVKYGLVEQRSLDVLWNMYVNKQKLYLKATKNKGVDKPSRQYIAIDNRIRKYLKTPLQRLVDSFKGKSYTVEDIDFKDGKGKESVAGLVSFKLFHFSRAKKAMTKDKKDLVKSELALTDKPKSNKIFKEYERLVFEAKVAAEVSGEDLKENTFVEAAVKVSQTDLKDVGKIGPYTPDHIEKLNVAEDNGSMQLAVRALLDTEVLIMKKLKAEFDKTK